MLVALSLYVYFVSSIEYGMFAQDVKDAGVCNQKYKIQTQTKIQIQIFAQEGKDAGACNQDSSKHNFFPPNVLELHPKHFGGKIQHRGQPCKYVLTKILKCVKKIEHRGKQCVKNSTCGKQWG